MANGLKPGDNGTTLLDPIISTDVLPARRIGSGNADYTTAKQISDYADKGAWSFATSMSVPVALDAVAYTLGPNRLWVVGDILRFTTADSTAAYFTVEIATYNPATGALTGTCLEASIVGTYANWTATYVGSTMVFPTSWDTVAKITEAGNLPLWDGGVWPGGGGEVSLNYINFASVISAAPYGFVNNPADSTWYTDGSFTVFADVSTAFNALLDGGVRVYVPSGIYYYDADSIRITGSDVELFGDGLISVFRVMPGSSLTGPSDNTAQRGGLELQHGIARIDIHDICIDCNVANNLTRVLNGIWGDGDMQHIKIHNNFIINTGNAGINILPAEAYGRNYHIDIHDNYIENVGYSGIRVSYSKYINISRNTVKKYAYYGIVTTLGLSTITGTWQIDHTKYNSNINVHDNDIYLAQPTVEYLSANAGWFINVNMGDENFSIIGNKCDRDTNYNALNDGILGGLPSSDSPKFQKGHIIGNIVKNAGGYGIDCGWSTICMGNYVFQSGMAGIGLGNDSDVLSAEYTKLGKVTSNIIHNCCVRTDFDLPHNRCGIVVTQLAKSVSGSRITLDAFDMSGNTIIDTNVVPNMFYGVGFDTTLTDYGSVILTGTVLSGIPTIYSFFYITSITSWPSVVTFSETKNVASTVGDIAVGITVLDGEDKPTYGPLKIDTALNNNPAGNDSLFVVGNSNTERIKIRSSVAANYLGSRCLGTTSNPSAPTLDSDLVALIGGAWVGSTSEWINSLASWKVQAAENLTETNRGTRQVFFNTGLGGTTFEINAVIENRGLIIGDDSVKYASLSAADKANTIISFDKIRSMGGGFVFPDNTVQTTAATGGSPITSRTGLASSTLNVNSGHNNVLIENNYSAGAVTYTLTASGASNQYTAVQNNAAVTLTITSTTGSTLNGIAGGVAVAQGESVFLYTSNGADWHLLGRYITTSPAGGSSTQMQYNSSGGIAGASMTWDAANYNLENAYSGTNLAACPKLTLTCTGGSGTVRPFIVFKRLGNTGGAIQANDYIGTVAAVIGHDGTQYDSNSGNGRRLIEITSPTTWTANAGYTETAFMTLSGSLTPSERLRVMVDGAVKIVGSSSAPPTASSSYRGAMWVTQGGAGVADTIQICLKSNTDTYSWKTIATG